MLFMFCWKWNDEAYNHYICNHTIGIVRSFPNWGNMNAITTNTLIFKTSFSWMCSLGSTRQCNAGEGKCLWYDWGRRSGTPRSRIWGKGFIQSLFFPIPAPALLFTLLFTAHFSQRQSVSHGTWIISFSSNSYVATVQAELWTAMEVLSAEGVPSSCFPTKNRLI